MSTLSELLLAQEQASILPSFSNQDALTLGLSVIDIVKEQYHQGVAIHIERNHEVVFTYFMEGTSANNALWVQRKKRVVDLYGHSTMYVGENARERGKSINEFLSPFDYQAEGGCFPILVKDTGMVGTITVSGLTSEDDHAVCVEAIRRLIA